jgi:hypothetical protein
MARSLDNGVDDEGFVDDFGILSVGTERLGRALLVTGFWCEEFESLALSDSGQAFVFDGGSGNASKSTDTSDGSKTWPEVLDMSEAASSTT